MHSQRRVNQEMSKWVTEAIPFKKRDQPNPQRARLAEQLGLLELHLNQWNDKYEAVIPNDAKRSLVYLADEKSHGVQFPPELERAVEDVIASWQ